MILNRHSFGIWSFVAKRAFKATFKKPDPRSAAEAIKGTLRERELAVYIHIPFCRRICRYCPYVRYPVRNDGTISNYIEALKTEIKAYGKLLQELDPKVIDVHAGGGTPSLLTGQQFEDILDCLTEHLGVKSKIAIEANPEDLADEKHTFELADHGVTEVSLGVQSFNRDMLGELGRGHSVEDSLRAIENLRQAGTEYINIDMMYMIPGQSLSDWVADLRLAAGQDVDEITCYPTLMTEYCPGHKLVEKGEVNQPNKRTYKQMVHAAENVLSSEGFEPVEIYGYSRRSGWKYVTVNYEMEGPLLGLGCGAMGFVGEYEYQNTCSVPEYIRTTLGGALPVAGGRHVDTRERAIRYATCRLFICRGLDLSEFERRLGSFDRLISKTGFGRALRLLRLLGYIRKREGRIELTRRGLFTAHLLCWAFVLNVPCRMCEEYLKTPWPLKVTIP